MGPGVERRIASNKRAGHDTLSAVNRTIGVVALGVGLVMSSQACGSSDENKVPPSKYDAGGESSSSGAAPASAGEGSGDGGTAGGTDGGTTASGASGAAAEGGTAGGGGTAGEGGVASGGDAGSAGQGGGTFEGNCDEASLLVNCGFELPAAATGGFVLRSPGADVGGWLVIGAPGNVGTLNSAYADAGFSWPAQEGVQTMDLTGNTNTATGVSQAVATLAGEEYELSFWLGNIVDPGGHYGVDSTVSVLVDGSEILKPTNSEGAGTSSLAWRQFVATFTAQGASTTIAFVNADGAADHNNIIDNVVLVQR